MAPKTTEAISTVVLRHPDGKGMFLTPADGDAAYRLVIRRSYVTVEDGTAQDAYSSRRPDVVDASLESELSAWDLASEQDLAKFEDSLGEL